MHGRCTGSWCIGSTGLVRGKKLPQGQRLVRFSLHGLPDSELSARPTAHHRGDEDQARSYTISQMPVCTRSETRMKQRVSTSTEAALAASTRVFKEWRSSPRVSVRSRWGRRGERQAHGKETRRSGHGVPRRMQAAEVSRLSRRWQWSREWRRQEHQV